MSIRTYDPPPTTGFDPLTAPDSQLLHHGFPARPDPQAAPELRKLWESAVSSELTYVMSTFRETAGKTNGPVPRPLTGSGTSPNWSGSGVSVTNAGDSFWTILGKWTVPNPWPVSQGFGKVSQWIGIDGYLRVGTESSVFAPGPSRGVTAGYQWGFSAWWGWGDQELVIDNNFPVAAGDFMWGALCVNSPTSATIFLINVGSGIGTSFTVTVPQGSLLGSKSAEWIVGRPVVDGALLSLPDYGVVYFDEVSATLATGSPGSHQNPTTINLGSGTLVTMVGSNNNPLSVPTIETPQLMKVTWLKAS